MRDIKFRMWHKNIKQMYDVGLINLQQGLIFMKDYLGYTQSSFAIEEVELMQYVGIKDKNEKKIYEGDILQDSDCVYEVIFEYGCFDVKVIKVLKNVGTQKGLKYRISFIVSDNDSIEIIRQ